MLEHYYQQLLTGLSGQPDFLQAEWREYAGQRFLYVDCPLPIAQVVKRLMEAGNQVALGTKLKVESIYVRSVGLQHVFRFRFLVPSEKQFCCGNLCEDCFLLREKAEQ